MPIEFRCSQCQRLLRLSDEYAGARARCPQCGNVQQVPDNQPPQPQQPPFGQQSTTPPYAGSSIPPAGTPPQQPQGGSGYPGQQSPNPFADQPERNPFSDNPYESPYAAGYRSPQQFTEESARSKVMGPGIALIIFGALGIMGCMLGVFGAIMEIVDGGMNDDDIGGLFVIAFGLLMSVIVTAGGARMIVLRNYGLAMAATIVSFFCGVCTLISIPFSIWALVVLCDTNVRHHFR